MEKSQEAIGCDEINELWGPLRIQADGITGGQTVWGGDLKLFKNIWEGSWSEWITEHVGDQEQQ